MSFEAIAIKRTVRSVPRWFLEVSHPSTYDLVLPTGEEWHWSFEDGMDLKFSLSRQEWPNGVTLVDILDLDLKVSEVQGTGDPIRMAVRYALPSGHGPEKEDTVEITRSGGGGANPIPEGGQARRSKRRASWNPFGKGGQTLPRIQVLKCACGRALNH